jgi:hypothetical protein
MAIFSVFPLNYMPYSKGVRTLTTGLKCDIEIAETRDTIEEKENPAACTLHLSIMRRIPISTKLSDVREHSLGGFAQLQDK